MAAAPSFADPWRFQSSPEIYVLVVLLVAGYVRWAWRSATRRQRVSFVLALATLFAATTWPLHHLGREYLYSAHMVQHMVLAYFFAPLVWLATPASVMRRAVGTGRRARVLRVLSHPVIAGGTFVVVALAMSLPAVVEASLRGDPLHHAVHALLVAAALLMWLPVVAPLPELRLRDGAAILYLFVQSILPTVPAAWLAFADGVIYEAYGRQPVRVSGLSAVHDQQLAGAVMKLVGGLFLWGLAVARFFRRFGRDDELTFEQVAAAFDATAAPREPVR